MIVGTIILLDLRQSDGVLKRRPALVIRELPPYGDLLIAGISTQLHQEIPDLDIRLMEQDPCFPRTGLLRSSLVRLTMLARVAKNDPNISRTIGRIEAAQLVSAQERLAKLIRG
jgi:mRNA interferase MazF